MVIDLNPEMGTRAKQAIGAVQAERLSPQTPQNGDAIVRSHGNANRESHAEMTWPNCYQQLATNITSNGDPWVVTKQHHLQLGLQYVVRERALHS